MAHHHHGHAHHHWLITAHHHGHAIIIDSSWAHHLVLEHEEPDQVVDVDPSEDFVVPELVEKLHLRKMRRNYLPSS